VNSQIGAQRVLWPLRRRPDPARALHHIDSRQAENRRAEPRTRRPDSSDHTIMSHLKYLSGYPPSLQEKVKKLIDSRQLGAYLADRYPRTHDVQTDRALYAYCADLKREHLRSAEQIDKVTYDSKLDVVRHALGLHTSISRVQGGKLKAKKEIRIASLFKSAAPEFLKMIVVHELAHLKESDHNKAFYRLCEFMQPGYHQVEFDLRLYLTHRELVRDAPGSAMP
jgi:predicted metal-dependent hydrolase